MEKVKVSNNSGNIKLAQLFPNEVWIMVVVGSYVGISGINHANQDNSKNNAERERGEGFAAREMRRRDKDSKEFEDAAVNRGRE
ncbi:hypothetical protein [endosymbiont of Acanthamoeba sp. UWC8]|uniref:hypothetical protein n=1 Tax=endosymbiont of Acanthamoeba sp. UWC8 TaxID=86106 RepID=UPI00130DA4CA|nr:hypothetical protein [endosymbiont of Acanthamoeba sp. UWC8]